MIGEAAQKYGIVVRDRTFDAAVFYTEEPPAGSGSVLAALLDGKSRGTALKAFPWDKLEVLDAPTCSGYGTTCTATQRAVIDVNDRPATGSILNLDTRASVVNFGRSRVDWDLDGDGVYETAAGGAPCARFVPRTPGP